MGKYLVASLLFLGFCICLGVDGQLEDLDNTNLVASITVFGGQVAHPNSRTFIAINASVNKDRVYEGVD